MNMDTIEYMARLDECIYWGKTRTFRVETVIVGLIPDMERNSNPHATLLVKSLLGRYLEALEELADLKETLKELAK
jgi:hypothetical protein